MPKEWGLGEWLSFGVEMKVGKDMGHLETVDYEGAPGSEGDLIDVNEEEYEDFEWQEDVVAGYEERSGSGEGRGDEAVPF